MYMPPPLPPDNTVACSMLLKSGADPKAKDKDGLTGNILSST